MGKVSMKGATPVGSASLCRTCSWAQIIRGYRESEMLVVCTDLSPNVAIPFVVRDCTAYNDRNRPDWNQMKRLAIDVSRPLRLGRPVGFGLDPEDDDQNEDN